MIQKIISKIFNPKKSVTGFHDLSAREQKKIITKAVRGSNEDQRKLVKEYESRFGSSFIGKCNIRSK